MTFESCPREDVDRLNDTGPVYILEKSRMDLVPGWYTGHSDHKVRNAVELVSEQSAVCILSTLTRQQSGLHTAPSLLSICIGFVGENIGRVESLVDFPEIVGQALFEAAAEKGNFDDVSSQNTVTTLRLFTQAYGPLMLESANLENSYSDILNIMPVISSVFDNITELNVFGCGFGENEALLQQISHFSKLERLNLQYNQLTDTCMRMITAPTRVMKKGPRLLQVLDLSRNPCITEASARYLLCFKHLRALDLSGTKFHSRGVQRLEDVLRLEEDPDVTSFDGSHVYETWGWAASIVREWVEEAHREAPSETNDLTSFYGNCKTKQSRCVKVARRRMNRNIPSAEPVLQLGRVSDGSLDSVIANQIQTELQQTVTQHNGNRLGCTTNETNTLFLRMSTSVVDEVRETADRRKKAIRVQTSCEIPCEELLSCYRTGSSKAETSKCGNAPKLTKIFSLATTNDNGVVGCTSELKCRESTVYVSNRRKRRKIVVVRKQTGQGGVLTATCDKQLKPDKRNDDKRHKSSSEFTLHQINPANETTSNTNSLWKAMHSEQWC